MYMYLFKVLVKRKAKWILNIFDCLTDAKSCLFVLFGFPKPYILRLLELHVLVDFFKKI